MKDQSDKLKTEPIIKQFTPPTNQERLDFYRSHGLVKCNNYPGGDEQFEKDVLSGEFHETKFNRNDFSQLKKEDLYILHAMLSDTIQFDTEITRYLHHPILLIKYEDWESWHDHWTLHDPPDPYGTIIHSQQCHEERKRAEKQFGKIPQRNYHMKQLKQMPTFFQFLKHLWK